MPSRKNFASYVERRRKSAKERQAVYDALTPTQKLARPGLSNKERNKILAKNPELA